MCDALETEVKICTESTRQSAAQTGRVKDKPPNEWTPTCAHTQTQEAAAQAIAYVKYFRSVTGCSLLCSRTLLSSHKKGINVKHLLRTLFLLDVSLVMRTIYAGVSICSLFLFSREHHNSQGFVLMSVALFAKLPRRNSCLQKEEMTYTVRAVQNCGSIYNLHRFKH